MLTRQQIIARTNIPRDKAIHNLKAALATTDSLHSTTTKVAREIDQALLAQVCSLLPSSPLISNTPSVQLDSAPSLQQLHSTPRHTNVDITHSLVSVASRYAILPWHCFSSTQLSSKRITANMSRLRLNMNFTNPRLGTPNQDSNPCVASCLTLQHHH